MKVDDNNKGYYSLKPANRKAIEEEYEKLVFDNDVKMPNRMQEEEE